MSETVVPPVTPPVTPPSLVPDKFVKDGKPDVEALAKSYLELEKARTAAPPAPVPAAPAAPPKEGLAITPNAPVDPSKLFNMATAVKQAGLTPEAMVASWQKNGGKLDETQYVALERAGVSREQVNSDVSGQEALYNQRVANEASVKSEVDTLLGGAAQHETLREWAKTNISAARLAGFEKMIVADPRAYVDIAQIIEREHARATGTAGSKPSINGQPGSGSAKPCADAKDFAAQMKLAGSGDANALARIHATPQSTINSWAR